MKLPDKIEPFKENDSRTPWSAETINEMVAILNAIRKAKGTNGIRITWSDGIVVIDGKHVSGSNSNNTGSSGGDTYTTSCISRYA